MLNIIVAVNSKGAWGLDMTNKQAGGVESVSDCCNVDTTEPVSLCKPVVTCHYQKLLIAIRHDMPGTAWGNLRQPGVT